MKKFKLGDYVAKKSGSQWSGRIVGEYSTELTPEGYAVESSTEHGSVQIYPAKALELAANHSERDLDIVIAPPQQQAEPVGWANLEPGFDCSERFVFMNANAAKLYDKTCYKLTPVYTAPPQRQWQDLTNEEIERIKGSANRAIGYIRVTAAKLKEKNT
jgi:hypothetical protein